MRLSCVVTLDVSWPSLLFSVNWFLFFLSHLIFSFFVRTLLENQSILPTKIYTRWLVISKLTPNHLHILVYLHKREMEYTIAVVVLWIAGTWHVNQCSCNYLCVAPSDTMGASQQRLNSKYSCILFLCLASKFCSVFNKRVLSSNCSGKSQTMGITCIYLGISWGSLTNNKFIGKWPTNIWVLFKYVFCNQH